MIVGHLNADCTGFHITGSIHWRRLSQLGLDCQSSEGSVGSTIPILSVGSGGGDGNLKVMLQQVVTVGGLDFQELVCAIL